MPVSGTTMLLRAVVSAPPVVARFSAHAPSAAVAAASLLLPRLRVFPLAAPAFTLLYFFLLSYHTLASAATTAVAESHAEAAARLHRVCISTLRPQP